MSAHHPAAPVGGNRRGARGDLVHQADGLAHGGAFAFGVGLIQQAGQLVVVQRAQHRFAMLLAAVVVADGQGFAVRRPFGGQRQQQGKTQAKMAQGRHDILRRSAPGRVSPPARRESSPAGNAGQTDNLQYSETPWGCAAGPDRPAPHRG